MGLPGDFFSEMKYLTEMSTKSAFPNLNETWLRATWSREDVQMAVATGATHTNAKFVLDNGGIFCITSLMRHSDVKIMTTIFSI